VHKSYPSRSYQHSRGWLKVFRQLRQLQSRLSLRESSAAFVERKATVPLESNSRYLTCNKWPLRGIKNSILPSSGRFDNVYVQNSKTVEYKTIIIHGCRRCVGTELLSYVNKKQARRTRFEPANTGSNLKLRGTKEKRSLFSRRVNRRRSADLNWNR
jgi:hypothetical protein